MIDSLKGSGDGAARTQQAAAELLRMQMMQSSLSLLGATPSSQQAALPMLASLASSVPSTPYPPLPALPGSGASAQSSAQAPAGAASQTATTSGSGEVVNTDNIEKSAERFLGTPYLFGGEGPAGIDCSSFVQQVFKANQIDLPRTAREQSQLGSEVAAGDLKRGDLLFFHTYASYPSHVGIYLGDGKMIHASSVKGEVTVSNINSDYYRSRFMGAKRMA